MWLIFIRFLMLGLTSFGGPSAHIGYFRRTFVTELGWLDERQFGSLVALCQFLPGPGSSQLGFAIGYGRAGLGGALLAFLGFTLPSFTLMYLLAVTSANALGLDWFEGVIHGLKLLAVVVVADACLGMYKQFCQRSLTRGIMLASALTLLLAGALWSQMLVLLLAALLGSRLLVGEVGEPAPPTKLRSHYLVIFGLLLLGAFWCLFSPVDPLAQLAAGFYQAGALVFGGGHVVLPLLQQTVGAELSADRFLTGYAAAQAMPGPMFTLAAFLGADSWQQSPLMGALLATAAIFLPGFLLLLGLLPAWHSLSRKPAIAGAIAAVNAAVVGLLVAALYQPVFVSAVAGPRDMALILLGFACLQWFRLHIVLLVAGFALAGLGFELLA
ncbi:chromate efflux transporter [Shewanella cyperi]|uniref:chromate efflux transporter n=1 Tax=Shewanella cyperi TaxID=2814292 RepID=UPI001A94CFF8|nr:chromate efflux transporter [Shewanella cyperi]QSX41359.1 chromate efflux transporter [Shewanella cyperi]